MLDIIEPNVFAVGVGAIQERPAVVSTAEGAREVRSRQVLPLCLAFDHRALDFGDLLPFIQRLDKLFASFGEIEP